VNPDSRTAASDREIAGPRAVLLFGHPAGLAILFGTEMWERFSYYGMRALLVLYMVRELLHPGHVEQVIGFGALSGALQWLSGPLDIQPLSSEIYGLYTGLVYLTPLAGGMLADRVLGFRRTVILGGCLMALGHFLMAFQPTFLLALSALILGNGAFKPNISSQVGGLYGEGDARQDRAYSIFYVGINLGALLGSLACGTLGERAGWHYGFIAAGAGMLAGLAVYLVGARLLPPEAERPAPAPAHAGPGLRRRALLALLALCAPVTLFWAAYEQAGNTIALWADQFTDRSLDILHWHLEIPATWFQALNPFMILAFTPGIVLLWSRQSRRGREPSTVSKMAIGCLGLALANLLLAAAAWHMSPGSRAAASWLFLYFVVATVGELYLSPTGLSLVSKVAPRHMLSLIMGLWLATSFSGNLLAGWLGTFWGRMDKAHFFLMIAAIAAAAAAAIALFNRPLQQVLDAD
jgi:POT family proton-dependent oligopeptide transporter